MSNSPTGAPPAPTPSRLRSAFSGANLTSWGPIFAFIALIIIFGALAPATFLSSGNLLSILNDQAVLAILACGVTVVLLTGEFDMSIAGTLSISAVLSAGLTSTTDLPTPVVIVMVLVLGGLIGLFNAFLVTKLRILSLIATLAVGSILDGVVLAYTGGRTIFQDVPQDFIQLGQANVFGIQVPILYMIVVAVILWLVLKYTVAGRFLYAIGGNRNAARMSGIRVNRYVALAFVIAGVCAAFAGIIQAARNGSAQPSVGASFLLPAFAAAFLGSATLRRGQFHIVGTIVGVYLIATGASGFFILGAPYWVQYIFSGVILIIATASSGLLKSRRTEFK
jgi:ribose transport system permease protein